MKHIFLPALLAAVTLVSCKSKPAQLTFENIHLRQIYEAAKAQHKSVMLVAKGEGCKPCEDFELRYYKDTAFSKSITDKYVTVFVENSKPGNEWLSRVTNTSAIPGFVFTSEEMELRGIYIGEMSAERMKAVLAQLDTAKSFISERFDINRDSSYTTDQIKDFVGGPLKGQLQLEIYGKTKDKSVLEGVEDRLKKSIAVYPHFYNNFLLAQYYKQTGNAEKSRQYAKAALETKQTVSLTLNMQLKRFAHQMADSNYNEKNDAFMRLDSAERYVPFIALHKADSLFFEFTNTGASPMLIDNILSDCSCTVGDYPKEPVLPMQKGKIKVIVNGKTPGIFARRLRVFSNSSNSPVSLTIRGEVK
ncbi:uncharacterized protein DUF1573 [Chitinophaga dinghuensis]|uniref:Uncharacterized protein DUF1573 n=1 Tax=Chitinophaga dinghuensis TaxID=1539050 RepID=A0A327VR18_9BACT|nr:DUF1573 domain-containing protein [Chitinophaga dinghuensis]RAJ77483.1 uncharacterized protein DUF1573 [Chitinophaga dinghuensis]